MRPLDLAKTYLEIFYSGHDIEKLGSILAEDLVFDGPFFNFTDSKSYIDSLSQSPPAGMTHDIGHAYEDDFSACIIYSIEKPGVKVDMSQFFEIENDKIKRILLIFDGSKFA